MFFSASEVTDISEFNLISLTYSQECALYMWGYSDGDGNEGSGPCGLGRYDGKGGISTDECSEIKPQTCSKIAQKNPQMYRI